MENFVSIIINKDKINEHRDIVLDSIITTGNVGLLENEIEYEIYESENNTQVISVPLSKKLSEKQQEIFAKKLANKLFDKGHTEFDIEFGLTEDETITRTLRRGMRGEDVRRIQREIGMPAADQDGIFGPKTERAIRAFQQNAGIQVDGIVGQQTQSAILKYRMPGTGVAVQQPGPAYIDAPYPKTQPPVGKSELRKRKERERNLKVATPPERKVGQLPKTLDQKGKTPQDDALVGYGAGLDTRTNPNQAPVGGGGDISKRPEKNPSMFATGKAGHEDKGYAYVIPAPEGLGYSVILPGGDLWRELNNGMGRSSSEEKAQSAADRINKQQGLTVPTGGDDVEVDTSKITKPEIVTPQGLGQPSGSDTVGISSNSTSDTTKKVSGPAGMTAPDTDDEFSVDPNDATQRQQQQQNNWEKKYGSAPRDLSAGLPAEFTTQYLNPALDDLTSDTAEDLATELKGAPPPVANLVMDRMKKMLGIEDGDELLDMAREIEQDEPDQASALSTLADIYKKLEATTKKKNESVVPKPKGAFMFRERNEWDAKYGKTHNNDGSLKARTFISESKMQEVTFHDDNEFFEAYGVLWFNEDEVVDEAEYKGRKVKLGKPMAGDVKKFKVYVRNPKGNVVKVNFGQKGAKIKKSNPKRRRSFRARHNCDNPGPRHKARYWSCRKW